MAQRREKSLCEGDTIQEDVKWKLSHVITPSGHSKKANKGSGPVKGIFSPAMASFFQKQHALGRSHVAAEDLKNFPL